MGRVRCCCKRCQVYLFDGSSPAAGWTVDAGTATFNATSIDLSAGARISLDSPTLDGNNYSASIDLAYVEQDRHMRVYLGDLYFDVQMAWDAGATTWSYTITLSDGTTTTNRSDTGDGQTAPGLAICVNGSDLTGWSGWTSTSNGFGRLELTISDTLADPDKLAIENLGSNSETVTDIDLRRATIGTGYDTTECRDCYPEQTSLCQGCENPGGWNGSPDQYTWDQRFIPTVASYPDPASECFATASERDAFDCGTDTTQDLSDSVTPFNCTYSLPGAQPDWGVHHEDNDPGDVNNGCPTSFPYSRRCWLRWGLRHDVNDKPASFPHGSGIDNSTGLVSLIWKLIERTAGGSQTETWFHLEYQLPSPRDCSAAVSWTIGDMTIADVVNWSQSGSNPPAYSTQLPAAAQAIQYELSVP